MLSDIKPVSPRCNVPPARSLRSRRSSHFAAFSFSDRGLREISSSRNRRGDRVLEREPPSPEREISADADRGLDVRGVLGDGIGGDIGVDKVGEFSSGGGFLLELRLGRGGVDSAKIPNSDVGRDNLGGKLLTGSNVLNVGIVGDGGAISRPCVEDGFPAVLLRRGGGNDGGCFSMRE